MYIKGGSPLTSTNLSVSSLYDGKTVSFHSFNSGKWFNYHPQALSSAESPRFSISNVTSFGQNYLECTYFPKIARMANLNNFDIFYII